MGDVVSLKTKRKLGVQDTPKNDRLAMGGRYLGCLPKLDTADIRSLQELLACKRDQIDELIFAFDKDFVEYLKAVTDVLMYFKVEPEEFNSGMNELMVGEDGNCWIGTRKEESEDVKD